MDQETGRRAPAVDHALALVALLLLVAALWAPFGLRVGPTFEDWKALHWSDVRRGIPVLFPTRPLVFAPYAFAQLLTPEPLVALNLLQAGLMFGKGALVYLLLVRLLPDARALAFLAGALSIVFPADTGLFTLRKVMLHLAVFLDLVAVNLLLSLWRRWRWWLLAAIWATQAVSVASDYPSIPVLLASPILLAWRDRRISRRLLRVWAIWSVVPLVSLSAVIGVTQRPGSYENSLWVTSGLGPGLLATLQGLLARVARAYARHFAGAWKEALPSLGGGCSGDALVAVALTVLVICPVLWWLARRKPGLGGWSSTRPYLEIAALALAAMPLGFLLFLPTRWLATNWRVFFHSSIAAAVTLAALAVVVTTGCGRLRRCALMAFTGALLVLATSSSLAQHRGYYETSLAQQRLLAGMVREAPRVRAGALLLLLDRPPYPGVEAWRPCSLVSECVEMTLRYVYGRSDFEALFCAPGYRPRGERSEHCEFTPDEVIVSYRHPWSLAPRPVIRRYPYRQVVVFEATSSGVRFLESLRPRGAESEVDGYDPLRLIDRSAEPPPRVRTAFTRWPPASRSVCGSGSWPNLGLCRRPPTCAGDRPRC